MNGNLDDDVKQLAAVAALLQPKYAESKDAWEGSPFAWIKAIGSSRTRGAVGEELVAGWLASRKFNVLRSPNSDADRVVEGKRVEIKFSTLWKTGVYKFQQIRDQEYDLLMCLGVSPFSASCWIFSKNEILKYWQDPSHRDITGQHEGEGGAVAWLSVRPTETAPWLKAHGGKLSTALDVLGAKTGFLNYK